MNFIIHNRVGIKFKPKDATIGIPVPILEEIENKTVAENLTDEEFKNKEFVRILKTSTD